MSATPVHPDQQGNGSRTATVLQDGSLDCEAAGGSFKIYRLTQTYIFFEEPPEDVMQRNLFTDPVLDHIAIVEKVEKAPEPPKEKPVRKKTKKVKPRINNTIGHLEL